MKTLGRFLGNYITGSAAYFFLILNFIFVLFIGIEILLNNNRISIPSKKFVLAAIDKLLRIHYIKIDTNIIIYIYILFYFNYDLILRRPKQHRSQAPDVPDLAQTVKPWSDLFKIFSNVFAGA